MIYFDTAYLLKCYVKEAGWQEVRALAGRHEWVACSAYGRMELHAALHRKLREGEVTEGQLTTIFRQLELDESEQLWNWLSLTRSIMVSVADGFRTLPESLFVRTADATHLVTARTNDFREIYSSDTHLLSAAPHFGLEGKNIIDLA